MGWLVAARKLQIFSFVFFDEWRIGNERSLIFAKALREIGIYTTYAQDSLVYLTLNVVVIVF